MDGKSKVLQEVLADLKRSSVVIPHPSSLDVKDFCTSDEISFPKVPFTVKIFLSIDDETQLSLYWM